MFKSPIILILLFTNLSGCFGQSLADKQKGFETAISKSLNLELVSRDSDYQASTLRIFNDTLVGFWTRLIDNKQFKSYFIQSLKNPKYKIEFNNTNLIWPLISPVDYYKNGCIYFGKYLGYTMQSLCSDGTLTEYFNNSKDTDQLQPSVESQVLNYKNQVILSLNSGIFLFNMPTQKLIWKYLFKGKGEAPCGIFDNKFIVSQRFDTTLNVTCYDLDNHQIIWTQKFTGDSNSGSRVEFGPQYKLAEDNGNVIISGSNACYLIDINSGIVKKTLDWKAYLKDEQVPNFKIENNILYITDFRNNSTSILCIDMTTTKPLWELNGASFRGIYKNYIIGYTPDKNYLIIDKSSGIVKDKIAKPNDGHTDFNFVDDYILINHSVIYK